jgi:hypothetical protein
MGYGRAKIDKKYEYFIKDGKKSQWHYVTLPSHCEKKSYLPCHF